MREGLPAADAKADTMDGPSGSRRSDVELLLKSSAAAVATSGIEASSAHACILSFLGRERDALELTRHNAELYAAIASERP